MVKDSVFLTHPVFERDSVPVVCKEGMVDSAGYRPIADLVRQYRNAGLQFQVFQAAAYDGDLELNPLHRSYADPVDRDLALKAAIEQGKKAQADFKVARSAALDKQKKQFESEVTRVAEAIQRRNDAQVQRKASEDVPQETQGPSGS